MRTFLRSSLLLTIILSCCCNAHCEAPSYDYDVLKLTDFIAHGSQVSQICITEDGTEIFFHVTEGFYDDRIYRIDASGAATAELLFETDMNLCAVSSDGSTILCFNEKGEAFINGQDVTPRLSGRQVGEYYLDEHFLEGREYRADIAGDGSHFFIAGRQAWNCQATTDESSGFPYWDCSKNEEGNSVVWRVSSDGSTVSQWSGNMNVTQDDQWEVETLVANETGDRVWYIARNQKDNSAALYTSGGAATQERIYSPGNGEILTSWGGLAVDPEEKWVACAAVFNGDLDQQFVVVIPALGGKAEVIPLTFNYLLTGSPDLSISRNGLRVMTANDYGIQISDRFGAQPMSIESAPASARKPRVSASGNFIAFAGDILYQGQITTQLYVASVTRSLVVTNTNDSGEGSLRQAILNANANEGLDRITFQIPSLSTTEAATQTIELASSLPAITEAAILDGFTQYTGAVEVDGGSKGAASKGLDIRADGTIVQGLWITNFNAGVHIQDCSGVKVLGNTMAFCQVGIEVDGAWNCEIGRETNDPGYPSGNTTISCDDYGIEISGFQAMANKVIGNKCVGNGQWGVLVGSDASDNAIGGLDEDEGNIIQGNYGGGVNVASGGGNSIRNNRIYGNGNITEGGYENAILLGTGRPENDDGDGDFGGNDLQNYPDLLGLSEDGLKLIGELDSRPNRKYAIELFGGDTYDGEVRAGEVYQTVTNASGHAVFTIPFGDVYSSLSRYVVTAIDMETNDTSPYSEPWTAIVVNDEGDKADFDIEDGKCDVDSETAGNQCTLRAAIENANHREGRDRIIFAYPMNILVGAAGSALPEITEGVEIVGIREHVLEGPQVILRPAEGYVGDGLTISGGDTSVQQITVEGFKGNGIVLKSKGENLIKDCHIGQGTPSSPFRNSKNGVLIDNCSSNIIGKWNVISGNDECGVLIRGMKSTNNYVIANRIGPSIDGQAIRNGSHGILLEDASYNQIGLPKANDNWIIGNGGCGIKITGPYAWNNKVNGNGIGWLIGNTTLVGNSEDGILIESPRNEIGTSERNTILGNGGHGIHLSGDRCYSNSISQNTIGDDYGGKLNKGCAVMIDRGAHENTIGGRDHRHEGNTIKENDGGAIVLQGAENIEAGVGNTILGNEIETWSYLGIDLLGDNLTQYNDDLDVDTGPNNLQNYPEIHGAFYWQLGTHVRVYLQGVLDCKVGSTTRLEFYTNADSKYGARHYLGSTTVARQTADASPTFKVSFNSTVAGSDEYITGLSCDESSGDTSELSPHGPLWKATVDSDMDGIPDPVEDDGPYLGDANQDGLLDSVQSNTITFPQGGLGSFAVVESASGTSLSGFEFFDEDNIRVEGLEGALNNGLQLPSKLPYELAFPAGLCSFRITGVSPGATTEVTFWLPEELQGGVNGFYLYGPSTDDNNPHWHRFVRDASQSLGAEMSGYKVVIHFQDGGLGDMDLDSSNGEILSFGGPTWPRLDLNGDGKVNEGDLPLFIQRLTEYGFDADFNEDFDVNSLDLLLYSDNWRSD